MKPANKCRQCGGILKVKNIKGQTMPWKDFPFVELEADIEVLACIDCDDFIVSGSDNRIIDQGLENSVRSQTAIFLSELKRISRFSQKKIANKIGLTEVYISELIGKKRTPSYQVFNLIKVLAHNFNALKDLDCFKGNCHQINRHILNVDLAAKYIHITPGNIDNYAFQSDFQGILDEKPRAFH